MVLGIITAIAICPGIIGTAEAVRQGQKANAREQHRGRKSHLVVTLPKKNSYSQKFDGSLVVLKDNKLFVDTAASLLGTHHGHPFTGYYLPYPANQNKWKAAGWKGEGMVSTISDGPPILNWIYVDSKTHEVKYGVRAEAEPHLTGPWDCTDQDRRLTFEGWEGFTAVQEDEEMDLWALYFDRDDNGLRGEGQIGWERKRMLQVQIARTERVKTKEMANEERDETLKRIATKEKEGRETVIGEGVATNV
ncbi:hypothetical protein K469DRAFT_622700 [Zopfia rhizophila CBS 207.26]|uniref:Uncharacterized protein n=1 Tax=Zopfia rhizophila CBS 207.26 TaxID=1314779 RepID=A0A6A6EIH4_9PEZI|nr:hypothetical protein K469DRAFT_622700 [Zopfia rhizophila CBS 207.26]